jgi:hypothetical protein
MSKRFITHTHQKKKKKKTNALMPTSTKTPATLPHCHTATQPPLPPSHHYHPATTATQPHCHLLLRIQIRRVRRILFNHPVSGARVPQRMQVAHVRRHERRVLEPRTQEEQVPAIVAARVGGGDCQGSSNRDSKKQQGGSMPGIQFLYWESRNQAQG